jgi:chaperonin GroES
LFEKIDIAYAKVMEENYMSSPITPLGDRVVAVREEAQTKTASGLYLPDNAKEKPVVAKIVAVGSEAKSVKVGDKILYKDYSTTEVAVNGTEYLIVKEEDILGTVA